MICEVTDNMTIRQVSQKWTREELPLLMKRTGKKIANVINFIAVGQREYKP